MNVNVTVPNLYTTIKIPTVNTPIRPTMNWINAPAYELARYLSKNTIQLFTSAMHIQYSKLHPSDGRLAIHRNASYAEVGVSALL
jgi:hypothetical protein